MDAIVDTLDWRDETNVVDLCDYSPTKRLLDMSSLAEDPRRIVDYEPQDVDDAIGKLVYLAASLISGRITLARGEMASVLKSVDKKL
ncbi:hypothetical protein Brsp06_04573 [Brucella sp. NBRC 13694]|jgi:hypothetical protein|nr:hypothetical protein [Ochrobactrum sp. BTU2]MCR5944090.1 hypothetical protein [Ochrobactrum sp. XJ1]